MKAIGPYPSAYCSYPRSRTSSLPRRQWFITSRLASLAPALVVGTAIALLAILAVQPGSSQFEQTAAAWLGQAGLLLMAAAWLAERVSTLLQLSTAGLVVAIMALVGLSQPGVLPFAAMLAAVGGALAIRATAYRQLFVAWLVFHVIAAVVLALT